MRKMLFPLPQIKTKGQVLCYQKLRAESLQWGAVWQESILLWTWLHLPFFPEPFLVNYAQSVSVSVIIHFFINSYIFLTIFHHSSCSYGNTFSNIHSLRVTALLWVEDNWMGQPASVPVSVRKACKQLDNLSDCQLFPILKIYIFASITSKTQYLQFKRMNGRWCQNFHSTSIRSAMEIEMITAFQILNYWMLSIGRIPLVTSGYFWGILGLFLAVSGIFTF